MNRVVNSKCWICEGGNLRCVRSSTVQHSLSTDDFSITDSKYGVTAAIYDCEDCGFRQCSELDEVSDFYARMQDEQYEEGRQERSLQAKKLLRKIENFKSAGRLIDIGAGSGILLENALQMQYAAEGIEPSTWLASQAKKLGLNVKIGALPDTSLEPTREDDRFDIVTAIDVLEHVPEPVNLLRSISKFVKLDGVCILVTPDAGSFFARLLGFRWWHYRIAHISYFRKKDLEAAFEKTGFEIIEWSRPGWYFSATYLMERIQQYLPRWLHFTPPKFLNSVTIPLNLFDSWMVIVKKKGL